MSMKIGMLGLGSMARGMAGVMRQIPEAEPWACASRSMENAWWFAEEFGFRKCYGSYEKLYQDRDVQLVYIATTHDRHYEQARECLLHGKHVLCEKSLTVHAWEAEELVRLAEEKGLFLMEAQILRFLLMSRTLREILDSGMIGRPLFMEAGYFRSLEHVERVIRPELGGGALLDIGVYPLTLASIVLGPKLSCTGSDAVLTASGVDGVDHILLRSESGMLAAVTASICGNDYRDGRILGTEGSLVIRNVNSLSRIEYYNLNGECFQCWDKSAEISDYSYELLAAIHAIETGKTQCEEYSWEAMLEQMRLLDSLRKQWGVTGA